MIPLGIVAGWGISRMLPQKHFDRLVQVLLVLTSVQLILSATR